MSRSYNFGAGTGMVLAMDLACENGPDEPDDAIDEIMTAEVQNAVSKALAVTLPKWRIQYWRCWPESEEIRGKFEEIPDA